MNPEKLRTLLTETVASGDIPSIAAAITGPDGPLFQHTAGENITPETIFWIASMTKPVTSVAIMQLIEHGKLTLETPVGDFLPHLKNPQIINNGTLTPAQTPITVKHLLTHTAGLSYGFASKDYQAYAAAHNLPQDPAKRASLNLPLLFEPGTNWEYGISTDWLGLLIEAVSGQTLDAYFETNIFAPLGMTATTFMPPVENRAPLHQRNPDGSLHQYPTKPAAKPEFFSGGGGLYSTLTDYQKFLQIFLKPTSILSDKSIAAMTTNQTGALRTGIMRSTAPHLMAEQDVAPGLDASWGLGFLIYGKESRFGRPKNSYSWAGVANTFFWVDPVLNQAAILLMQLLPSGDTAAIKTLLGFEAAIYAAPQ
jgi:CubicO group peptidase (beta-lactamase class C family)